MSSLWTPGGEHPVGDRGPQRAAPRSAPQGGPGPAVEDEAHAAELEARMAELRQELADAPVESVVANHCYGLFELAALHLSLQPPRLPQAQLAIDALGALLEGLAGRLGDAEAQLRDGLAQLRLAYVQLKATARQTGSA